LEREQKKIAWNLKVQEQKRNEEQEKIVKAQIEKTRNIENKAAYKEKISKEIKEAIDKCMQKSSVMAQIRKKDQEGNFNRLQKQQEKLRVKMIDKFKESELMMKRNEYDTNKIKAQFEAELKGKAK
jgi:hypothetical protein